METKLHRGQLKREEENIIKNDFKYNIFKIKMDRLNELFDNLYVKQPDRYVIKNKLLEIVQCYLQDIGMNFVVFNENSKSFIKKYGEEIIIKEIKKHSQYINTNDVQDIIENCLE